MIRRTNGQKLLLVLAVALLPGAHYASAVPGPQFNLQSLTDSSELIVVAQVTRTDSAGVSSVEVGNSYVKANVMRADLNILTVLKGALSEKKISVSYLVPEYPLGYRTLGPSVVNVLFLKSEGVGSYQFTNPYYPSLPAKSDVSLPESDVLGRILAEEQAVLISPRSQITDRLQAADAIGSVSDSRAINVLVLALSDSSATVRLEAASKLAENDNAEGAAVACRALLIPPGGAPDYILHNLRVGIRDGVKDQAVVPCLTQLLHSKQNDDRIAAASALRHTASPSAVSALVGALDDPDEQVRFEAVVGIADFAGQSQWRPNLIQFHDDSAKFVSHWKAWAARR